MKIEEDCYYHIYNRGNNKDLIFFEDENYLFFLRLMSKHLIPYSKIYAYCLMPNHFHLFLKVTDCVKFEKAIKNLFISYSKSINKIYNRVGSLFQGRYKSKKIDSEHYFTRIITYIHQNPEGHEKTIRFEDYKYSSYKAYLSNVPTQISKEEVLEWFGGIEGFILDHQFTKS